jgi:hypothetical protein
MSAGLQIERISKLKTHCKFDLSRSTTWAGGSAQVTKIGRQVETEIVVEECRGEVHVIERIKGTCSNSPGYSGLLIKVVN